MKITGDFHTHSKYSDGRHTIVEMVDAARAKGLGTIALTDHGPSNIGTGVRAAQTYLVIKDEISKLQENRPDIRILTGAEADVVSCAGDIDVPQDVVKQLDLLLVGLHPYVKPKGWKDGFTFVLGNQIAKLVPPLQNRMKSINTKALVEAMHKHDVLAITHPGLGMPLDLDEVARACLSTNTAFEINTGHNFQKVEDIKRVSEKGVSFIVNSDAHFTKSVGNLETGLALLAHANVPPEQIINVEM
ncbi:PHP domain-containing protein [Candidatus Formimonas warabiya]|uniref:Polymerase/histidinol phosphatase N-terminal domain-containing protein n=1 Tax=Formimonas warabiya TaxID=1761012 RepID=A0A3G1KUM9_FORW1|nr:PHP domain-containing protein [Candidatus Formimonas warabiya]ATW25895.1 hypothetical protein DCMF_14940 [Candidatus Formimonas warabiya]